jgi:repressor LexA
MARYLTERQKQVLDFVRQFAADNGYAPTHREICEEFGFSSYGTVHKHLKLLEKKGYLRRHWNQKRGVELSSHTATEGQPDLSTLPFLGRIAAGMPIEAVAGDDSVTVPNHLLGAVPEDHFVLKVVGDSMVDEGIHDGDLVIVSRREQADVGEMIVALVGGDEATLKRFFPEGETVRLQPANQRMAPIYVAASEVRIQGVVVGLMRKF